MKIQESAEMYLETIYVLSNKKDTVRAIDIAHEMNFSKPSVSVSIHSLQKDGYLLIEENGNITLLDKGLDIAKRIYERHTVIGAMLEQLGVSHDVAYADACKIEHDISDESFECLKKHINKAH